MNLFEIVSLSARRWWQHVGLFLLAGLTLFIATVIGVGLFAGTLIADGIFVLAFGPSGTWIHNPLMVLVLLLTTAVGALASSYLLCASAGAFLHACARLGAGNKEVNFMGFVEYAVRHGGRFWLIALAIFAVCALFSVPVAAAGIFLSSYFAPALPLGMVAAISIALLFAMPFWLSWPAQVVRSAGAMPSIMASLRASVRSPVSSIVVLVGLLVLLFVPMVSLIFYPIYFFFIFAPLAGTLTLVYYEAMHTAPHHAKA